CQLERVNPHLIACVSDINQGHKDMTKHSMFAENHNNPLNASSNSCCADFLPAKNLSKPIVPAPANKSAFFARLVKCFKHHARVVIQAAHDSQVYLCVLDFA